MSGTSASASAAGIRVGRSRMLLRRTRSSHEPSQAVMLDATGPQPSAVMSRKVIPEATPGVFAGASRQGNAASGSPLILSRRLRR